MYHIAKGDLLLMKKMSLTIMIMLLFVFYSITVSATGFTDINGNWAQESISRLAEQGVFDELYETTFSPNDALTKEELVELTARTFNLSNIEKQALYGWIEHLMPMVDEQVDPSLTRAELVAVVANVLGLTEQSAETNDWYPSFDDVSKDYPLFAAIELVNKLDLLPTYVMNRFEPNRLSTKAEVAAVLDAAARLQIVSGEVTEMHAASNRMIVQTPENEYISVPFVANTTVIRNGALDHASKLAQGDMITAMYDTSGSVAIVSAQTTKNNNLLSNLAGLFQGIGNVDLDNLNLGNLNLGNLNIDSLSDTAANVADNDIIKKLAQVLTPEQVAAIMSGNWDGLNADLRYNLYGQLVEIGLAPWEAEAVLSQNWTALGDMGRDRISSLLSDYVGVSPEIFDSAINQNWSKVLEYAQVEIAQRLMTGLSM